MDLARACPTRQGRQYRDLIELEDECREKILLVLLHGWKQAEPQARRAAA